MATYPRERATAERHTLRAFADACQQGNACVACTARGDVRRTPRGVEGTPLAKLVRHGVQ
jgi:hypothetical protein